MASTATRNFMLPLPEVELLASMPIVVAAALWAAQARLMRQIQPWAVLLLGEEGPLSYLGGNRNEWLKFILFFFSSFLLFRFRF